MIKTEVDTKNYVFKIYNDNELFVTINGNYPRFLLMCDLLHEGMNEGEVLSFINKRKPLRI